MGRIEVGCKVIILPPEEKRRVRDIDRHVIYSTGEVIRATSECEYIYQVPGKQYWVVALYDRNYVVIEHMLRRIDDYPGEQSDREVIQHYHNANKQRERLLREKS